MELTKEIIMSSLKGDLIGLCKEKDINYTKKTKSQLQDLLIETLEIDILDIDLEKDKILNLIDDLKEENKNFNLTEQYHYIPTEGEVLITDTHPEPLKRIKKAGTTKATSPFKERVIEKPVAIDLNSNKSIYTNYLSQGKNFKLIHSGTLIYDSKKSGDLIFEEEYFSLNNQKFDYKNLKFKFA